MWVWQVVGLPCSSQFTPILIMAADVEPVGLLGQGQALDMDVFVCGGKSTLLVSAAKSNAARQLLCPTINKLGV